MKYLEQLGRRGFGHRGLGEAVGLATVGEHQHRVREQAVVIGGQQLRASGAASDRLRRIPVVDS